MKKSIQPLRVIGILEGISYLLLMGVCMPLKYIYSMPEPNYYMGMAHGVLFVAYCLLAAKAHFDFKMKTIDTFWVLLASLLPFGTFVTDKKILKKYS